MDTNKMREQFEAQFIEEYVRVLGEGARELASHTLTANPPLVSMSWWAWQASREAVVIVLPEPQQKPELSASEYRQGKADGVESGIIQCIKAIELQGIKVKA